VIFELVSVCVTLDFDMFETNLVFCHQRFSTGKV
jgi:hypothetical protein